MNRRTFLSLVPAAIAAPVVAKAFPKHSDRIAAVYTRWNPLVACVMQDDAARKWLFDLVNRHRNRGLVTTGFYDLQDDVTIAARIQYHGNNAPDVEIRRVKPGRYITIRGVELPWELSLSS